MTSLSKLWQRFSILIWAASCFIADQPLAAVEVPQIPPKALKETQDTDTVDEHEKAALFDAVKGGAPVVQPAWIDQIRQMAASHSHREGAPAEKFEVIFKRNGTLSNLQVLIARNAKRTPNNADQMHGVCGAVLDGKSDKLKLDVEEAVDGPDLYELFGVGQIRIVCDELFALRRLQQAFTRNGLDYTLQASVIVAPDGKSWAWQIGPAEEQHPNTIFGLYYYPITHELHSIHLDNQKAAAKLQKAAVQAGMQLKWVNDMRDR